MSTGIRNIAILRRHGSQQPATPGTTSHDELLQPNDPRFLLLAASWSKAVDVYLGERGMVATRAYAPIGLDRAGQAGMHRNNATVINLSQIFLGSIGRSSPLLVDDGTFATAQIVSEHPRGSWDGTYEEFDVRLQAIKMNSWVTVAVEKMEDYRHNSGSNLLSALFQVSYFRLVHAYIHEIGHLYQTFLGHGEQDTPPQMPGSRHDNLPEAGEFFEKALIGGLVDFYNDGTPIGSRVGYPWITYDPTDGGEEEDSDDSEESEDARRTDLHSIGAFLQPQWQGSMATIVTASSTSSTVQRTEGRRPQVQSGILTSTMRHWPAATMRTGQYPRPTGNDEQVARLRRLTSPPLNSEPRA